MFLEYPQRNEEVWMTEWYSGELFPKYIVQEDTVETKGKCKDSDITFILHPSASTYPVLLRRPLLIIPSFNEKKRWLSAFSVARI